MEASKDRKITNSLILLQKTKPLTPFIKWGKNLRT